MAHGFREDGGSEPKNSRVTSEQEGGAPRWSNNLSHYHVPSKKLQLSFQNDHANQRKQCFDGTPWIPILSRNHGFLLIFEQKTKAQLAPSNHSSMQFLPTHYIYRNIYKINLLSTQSFQTRFPRILNSSWVGVLVISEKWNQIPELIISTISKQKYRQLSIKVFFT